MIHCQSLASLHCNCIRMSQLTAIEVSLDSTMSESQHTVIVADYCRARWLIFSKVPSETFTKSWWVKAKNKREWVNKWVPDFIICHPKQLLFIELKKSRTLRGGMNGSVYGDEQIVWIEWLNRYEWTSAKFCHGSYEAIEFIKSFD